MSKKDTPDVWDAIGKDPELANARRKLSMHELRLIIRHARALPPLPDAGVRLAAKPVPYSSIVGGGLTLVKKDGSAGFIVNFIGTSEGITKEETAALSERFAWFVNEFGVSVPQRDEPASPSPARSA